MNQIDKKSCGGHNEHNETGTEDRMELQRSIGKLMALQDKMSAYRNAMSLMNYDGDTTAPKGTAKNRAHAMGVLSSDIYTMNTSEETLSLLNEMDEHREELDGKTARMTQLMLKEIRRMQKIPKDEYVSYRKLMVESSAVWHEAKEKSDFSLFEPYLQQVFDAKKKFASYCAPDMKPYDYWLGQYEEGLTMVPSLSWNDIAMILVSNSNLYLAPRSWLYFSSLTSRVMSLTV